MGYCTKLQIHKWNVRKTGFWTLARWWIRDNTNTCKGTPPTIRKRCDSLPRTYFWWSWKVHARLRATHIWNGEYIMPKGNTGHRVRPLVDLTGQRFGQLVAVSLAAPGARNAARWNCICDCGITTVKRQCHLTQGRVKTCGHIRKRVEWRLNSGMLKLKNSSALNQYYIKSIAHTWHIEKLNLS